MTKSLVTSQKVNHTEELSDFIAISTVAILTMTHIKNQPLPTTYLDRTLNFLIILNKGNNTHVKNFKYLRLQ
jgi:hypothetical protein